MAWYCSEAEVGYAMSETRRTRLADDDGDGSAESGVVTWAIKTASALIYSIISDNADIASDSTYEPETYVSGTYPILDTQAAQLAATYLRQRRSGTEINLGTDPTIQWCYKIRNGEASI